MPIPAPFLNMLTKFGVNKLMSASQAKPKSSVPAPKTGYGGVDYNNASYAQKKAMEDNDYKLAHDPVYAQTEYDRTQNTLKERQSQGMDIKDQMDYFNKVKGFIPAPPQPKNNVTVASATPKTTQSSGVPIPNFYDIAAGENARALAERRRFAQQQKDSLTSAYNRSNAILKDNRTLEDLQLNRNLDPFNGRTGFAIGMVGRERTLADESAQGNFNSAIQGIDQGLSDYQNTAADAIRARAYQLEQDAKRFGLEEGQLTGNYGNGRTLAGQNADRDYQLGLGSQLGYLPGYGQTLQGRQFESNEQQRSADNAFRDKQFGFQKGQQEWENNFKQGQLDWQKAQQTWENVFQEKNFEQEMKDAAASRGLQWAGLNQRDKEFIADQAFREKQFQYQREQDSQPDPTNFNDIAKEIDSSRYVTENMDGEVVITDPRGLEDYIFSLDLPESDTRRLFQRYGLKWGG